MPMMMLWFACAQEHPLLTDTAETDTDTDADSDSDADTDADTDSDADTDTTTGETGMTCLGQPSELELFAEARDDLGPCTTCNPGRIELYAGMRNPCPVDIAVDVIDACFVPEYELAYPNGTGMGVVGFCDALPVTITIPAGGVYEQRYHQEEMRQSGSYSTQATLMTRPTEQVVSTTFQIP